MKTVQLSGSIRTNVGKRETTALRNAGRVPGVLYGTGEQIHLSIKQIDIEKIVFSPDVYKIDLDVDGKKVNAIIQELQQHPVKDTIQHVDFLEVTDKKQIKIGLPVRLTGSSRGVLAGGKLLQIFRKLNIYALAKDIPEAITLDISQLRIGQSIRVKDVKIEGVEILDPQNAVIVSVRRSRGSVDDSGDDDK
jgi:large subunit ribosomal protein L25